MSFVNDSKATNVGSLEVALGSFDRPVVLIAGGRDKGQDFRPLASRGRTHAVRAVVLIGEGADGDRARRGAASRSTRAGSLAEAVRRGVRAARAATAAVLLSPGCASFDMFRELRGPRPPLQGRGGAAQAQGGARVSRGDRWLLVLPLALTAIGVVMVYSSSAILGITRYHDPNHFLTKQLLRARRSACSCCGLLARRSCAGSRRWRRGCSPSRSRLLVLVIGAGHVVERRARAGSGSGS